MTWTLAILLLAAPDVSGEWITSFGTVTFEQKDDKVTGSYGNGNTIEGTIDEGKLAFEYREGAVQGEGEFEFDANGQVFRGNWRIPARNRAGTWVGFRRAPGADKAKRADFSGDWFSNQGTMELRQDGDMVTGTYGSAGWQEIEGKVSGRVLELKWKAPWGDGTCRLELGKEGKLLYGLGRRTGRPDEWLWHGRRIEGHARDAQPRAAEIVDAISRNRLTYHLRAPAGWKPEQPVDAILILHGSNMSSKSYVNTIAVAWPELADRYLLIGIDGDKWADWSRPDDDRFNYHYMNWMGRSTFKGYPHTERDSPWAIDQALEEIKGRVKIGRIFVGGHSQGGFCTWAMCMHFPEKFAGAFPMSAALLMQSAPGVFEDEELIACQKALPIAIVHGETDPVVGFGGSKYAFEEFREHGFPYVRLIAHPTAQHMFARLPVPDAIAWLDAVSSGDPKKLAPFLESDDPRVATAAAQAAKTTVPKYEKEAAEGAARFLPLLKKNEGWLEGFYDWRDKYEFTEAAAEAMAAFAELRAAQEEAAGKLLAEGRKAMNERRPEDGWAKYEELVETYPASSHYRKVKGWLERR